MGFVHSPLRALLLLATLSGFFFVPVFAQDAQTDEDGDPKAEEVAEEEEEAKKEELPLEELQVLAEVFGKIKSGYVDEVTDVKLLRNAIKGMLTGLDPHSTFLEPEAFKEVRISTEGKFGGLGIEVTTEGGRIRIVAPIDGSPAADADLRSGDIVTRIDGKLVGDDLRGAVDSMRGEPGTRIVLTILREGESKPLEVPLVRAVIKVASVRGELLEPGYGYARITSFQSSTASNLRGQIEKLVRENETELKGLVLDLRNNPGGVLNGAVEVSDLFLEDGVIVSTRGRGNKEVSSESARPGDVLKNSPLVVLVNGGSASASEIVAGALQDHKRAIIMGTRTFGKGSVQTVIPMNNGGALKLTTSRYYTPNERSIQALGIDPDIVINQTEVSQGGGRKSVREVDLAGHLPNGNGEEENPSASDVEEINIDGGEERPSSMQLSSGEGLQTVDFQIREALNLLKGMSLVKSNLVTK
ncbi:MAG: S41 family peptidase [Acidiferrobacterales bacterium]|nr:S41 family peptidase [Acidiferrobacterales bacterium]